MNGILLASTVESITTRKDKTIKIVLGTQELSQGKAGEVFNLMNNLCAVYISSKEHIEGKEMEQVDKIEIESSGKTSSQRIRNVLFILWKQGNEGFKDFDSYYRNKTEMYIDHLKSKII